MPEWKKHEPYKVGDKIMWKGKKITITSANIQAYPLWVAPINDRDRYQMGDVVEHDGKLYSSLHDRNMAIPGDDCGLFWRCIGNAM